MITDAIKHGVEENSLYVPQEYHVASGFEGLEVFICHRTSMMEYVYCP